LTSEHFLQIANKSNVFKGYLRVSLLSYAACCDAILTRFVLAFVSMKRTVPDGEEGVNRENGIAKTETKPVRLWTFNFGHWTLILAHGCR
jgi:hypothetical protein